MGGGGGGGGIYLRCEPGLNESYILGHFTSVSSNKDNVVYLTVNPV